MLSVVLSAILLVGGVFSSAYAEDPPVYVNQFGTSGTGNGQFTYPHDIALDSAGNIWVTDTFNHRIQKLSSSGTYLSQFGTSGTGNGQFAYPNNITIDSVGNLWVADGENHRIQKFSSSGTYLSKFGTSGTGNGQLNSPWGIAIDSAGNIFVTDRFNHRIQKFNSSGIYLSQFGGYGTGNGQFNEPLGIALDGSGNIYVAEYRNNRIQKFSSAGTYLSQFGGYGTGNGQLYKPVGITFDISSNIFVADHGNNRIQKFITYPTSGVIKTPLPDTGITKCYNDTVEIPCPSPGQDFYGQDGNYTINPPSYTKLDANGNVLPDSATTWGMVKDNVTGLIWENKTVDGSIHDAGKTYTWDDAQSVFIAQLNASNFGGHNDWRLPSREELRSIVDYSRYNPAINTGYFPNTQSNSYSSSSTDASYTSRAWLMSFYYGSDGSYAKSNSYYVRAVRGGQSGSSANLVINNDGTVTDTTTGLMWQQATGNNGVAMTWKAALAYCENLSLADYTDWRLPNIKELSSLVDLSRYNPAIDPKFSESSDYWSSSTHTPYTNYAWYGYFYYGYDTDNFKSSSYYVRCVRGGQVQPATRVIALSGNLAFGDVATGQTSTPQTLTISNTGNSTLTVTSITYPAGFSGNWSGTIAAGSSQNVTVTFAPTAAQSYSGVVTVNSDKTSGTDTISISGTGMTKIISLSGNLAFGDVQVNSTKQSNLTISNIGNTKLTVSSITYPAGFTGNWNSGTIMPGASQVVTVTFTPTAIQSYSGEIKVNSDKTSGTDTAAISGTGTIIPTRIINLSGSLAFGTVKIGATVTKTLTIKNTGNSTLTVSSITYPSVEFTGNWSGTIEPNVAQDVIVTFTPKAAQTYNSTVKVNSDKTSGTDTISISATVIGDDIPFVIRTLSSCYSPGTKMTVTLKSTPPSGTLSYTISDSPPAGWTVSNISSPGSYDSANKKVKFIFFDGSAQTLTYDVLPLVSDTGDKSFAGNVLRASLSSAVTGMSDISQCQNQNNHPADVDADFSITGEELDAYITAWQNGELWNGVKIEGNYASVAGGIWLNGETYKYDPNAGSPPLCWVNTTLRSVRDNGASSVVRKMSAGYEAGAAVTVYLEVTVAGGSFYTIEETPPEGWTVSDISGNGHFDKVNKVVTFYGNQTKTWSYKVTPPAGTTGIKTFSGKSWFNGAEVAITGISSVSDTALSVTPGDINGSGGDPDLADAILTA